MAYKPWLNESDAEDVLFSSIHLFAGIHYLYLHLVIVLYICIYIHDIYEYISHFFTCVIILVCVLYIIGDKFYPGTGDEAANSTCSPSTTQHPPTATANATSTGTGTNNSSSSGSSSGGSGSKGYNVINIGLTPVGPGPWSPPLRSKLTGKQRAQLRA